MSEPSNIGPNGNEVNLGSMNPYEQWKYWMGEHKRFVRLRKAEEDREKRREYARQATLALDEAHKTGHKVTLADSYTQMVL
uniref:Uncharacterized protein n=1 Tax=Cyanothece sp. (strain PCC 7425 / ATCC 29141) TaxID=395961 RepID=B8HJM0_CYAP4